ncbi:MAG: hypothetical protein HS108_11375 [Planctomycetes bacterium]|nr:hypothetical protein [Planctomycetota bacterium]
MNARDLFQNGVLVVLVHCAQQQVGAGQLHVHIALVVLGQLGGERFIQIQRFLGLVQRVVRAGKLQPGVHIFGLFLVGGLIGGHVGQRVFEFGKPGNRFGRCGKRRADLAGLFDALGVGDDECREGANVVLLEDRRRLFLVYVLVHHDRDKAFGDDFGKFFTGPDIPCQALAGSSPRGGKLNEHALLFGLGRLKRLFVGLDPLHASLGVFRKCGSRQQGQRKEAECKHGLHRFLLGL